MTRFNWSVLALFAILLFGSMSHPVDRILPSVPKAHAASLSITLVGFVSGWNASSTPNPTITVGPGDSVTVSLSSGDAGPHRFVVDVDRDGKLPNPTCPPDKCSSQIPPSTTYAFPVDFAAGPYTYYCSFHPTSMFGNFIVQSPPTPNFSISANPTTISSLNAGAQGTSTITISPMNGFTGAVTLSLSPSTGLNAMLSQTSIAGGSGTSTLTVSAATPGSYNVNVTGTSGTLSHFVTVFVNVIGPDFMISANPTIIGPLSTATQGMSTLTVSPTNGFMGTVTLSTTPSTGLNVMVSPTQVPVTTMAGTSTLTVSATSAGTYNVNVTGTSGMLTHTVKATVYVGADFTITSDHSSLNINQGSSSSFTLTLQSLNGFSSSVNLVATVTPSGPSATVSPSTITLSPNSSGQSTVQVSTSSGIYSSTSLGNYTVKVTGTSGTISHSTSVTITVTSGTSSGTGNLPTYAIVGIAVAIVAAVVIAILAVRRRRPKK